MGIRGDMLRRWRQEARKAGRRRFPDRAAPGMRRRRG
ncbi:MAG: hypothetical protein LBG27_09685 [Spirochaetaceae bacterium]|nr:hypothetical protein [Spirochaetaceae bacterium]